MTVGATLDDVDLEQYRRELTGYCYRMLGSPFDADDAVQETLVRAWQKAESFEGRSSHRSWLYRIATNVCLDALRAGQRRALPMDLSSPVPSTTAPGQPLPETTWLLPVADADLGPDDLAVRQDSVRLAFVAALQHLPPRQRAVLVLREVLAWSAADVADLLDSSVASVNSALQRARATLSAVDVSAPQQPLGDAERALLARYVEAFEAYDMAGLVDVLHADASMSMPPLALWLQGRDDMLGWYTGFGAGCAGSRLVPVALNGSPGYAQYKPSEGGGFEPWCLQVVELDGDRISHVHHFLGPELFVRLGLPLHLPGGS
ncbi:MAG: polymerase sigma-70 factor [Frankiales bacterium]|nr:polymerase sigma-70 factor [Frankiales bacterium]